MTEADYIVATNLAKIRIIETILHDFVPNYGITEQQQSQILQILANGRKKLEDKTF